MFKRLIPLAVSLTTLLTGTIALADSSDFNQPINVEAVRQFIDGKNKTSLFKDDVRIKQGSLVIEADEVEVIASEGEGKEIFIARGKPASYSQTMDDGKAVSARANEIRYEVSKRTISLKGGAELRQDTSMVKGNVITYDMAKEQLLATGGEGEKKGRVTTVFRPEAVKDLNEDAESDNDNATEQEEKQP